MTLRHSLYLLILIAAPVVRATPGITTTEIKLGQTAAFTGPASELGLGMKEGLLAAFDEVNAAGGVNGRKILLIAKDDSYEPSNAKANAVALIHEDNVFLLIGSVGTPTALATVPLCVSNGVPFFAPFTGALRSPYNRYVIHVRASYDQEIEKLVSLLVDRRGLRRIGCLRQDDSYGQVGLNALTSALSRRGLSVVSVGNYKRNSTAVASAMLEIQAGDPDAVVMIGTYSACASYVKLAHQQGHRKTLFCSISFTGTRALLAELGPDAEGMIISEVVPNPASTDIPIVHDYVAALKRHDPSLHPDWISLEGYIAGRLFNKLAGDSGKDLTRESFLDAVTAAGSSLNLGGFPLSFGSDDHQGSDFVVLTQVHNGVAENLPPR